MKNEISKSTFKAQALEVMRGIEQSGEAVVITSHGKPALIIKPYNGSIDKSPLEQLEGSVLGFDDPTDPVGEDDWEAAN